jgi:hypothetical protein
VSGISSATAQAQTSLALFEAIKVALAGEPDVDIAFGFNWPPVNFDWVAVVDTESSIDPKNIGPARQLDETLTVTLSVGSWNPELSDEQRRVTFLRAFHLLSLIQDHIRRNDIELGGVVLWCVPGSSTSGGATPEEKAAFGEYTEISATFVAKHRIRTFQ